MLAAGLAGLTQIEENARRGVNAVARDERCPNKAQPRVLLGAIRNRLLQPVAITVRRRVEDPTVPVHSSGLDLP